MKIHKYNILQKIAGFTLVGFVRYLMMKIRKKQLLVGGSCSGCGSCCRKLSLDDGNGWIRNEADFKAIVAENPKYSCFKIIGYDNSGILLFKCLHISMEGKCGRYDQRFQFCRDFPDKNLIFCGGGLPQACGYHIDSVVPFSKILHQTIEKRNEKSPYS